MKSFAGQCQITDTLCFPVNVIKKILIAAEQKKVMDQQVVILNDRIAGYQSQIIIIHEKDSATVELYERQITDFGLIQAVNDSKPHAQTAAEKLAATFNNSFSGALAGGLESIGEGIGNALSGKDFGTQIFQVFGSLFSSIGKALIEFGIIRKGIEVIFKNPLIPAVIPIALGIAAVAAGQLFKNIKGARALGGNVGAGDEYLVGENGPEIFRPNTGGRIIPNNQIGTGSSRQQGGLMVQVAGSTTVKGQDLLIAFTLANQSKLRLQ